MTKHPKSSSIAMVATVTQGVFVGVLLRGLLFAAKAGRILHVGSHLVDEARARHYTVAGQVFFASAGQFNASFDSKEVVEKVRIDVNHAHFWDITAVSALDKVVLKFRREARRSRSSA